MLFSTVQEGLARTIRQEVKRIQVGTQEVKLSLYVDDMIYLGEQKTLRDYWNLQKSLVKSQDIKSTALICTNNSMPENEYI